jgi:hypothetical protein
MILNRHWPGHLETPALWQLRHNTEKATKSRIKISMKSISDSANFRSKSANATVPNSLMQQWPTKGAKTAFSPYFVGGSALCIFLADCVKTRVKTRGSPIKGLAQSDFFAIGRLLIVQGGSKFRENLIGQLGVRVFTQSA